MKRVILGALVAVALTLPLHAAHAYNQSGAEQYLLAHSASPWSTMALSVLGTQNIPTAGLKNINSSSAIDYEAPILAITALGQDPHSFGGSDYVTTLKSFASGGQLGDPSLLNDDIFGILALISSGQAATDQVISDSKSFLLAHQNPDGGWGFSISSTSDSNTTASSIVALKAFGLANTDSHIQNALAYLKTAQNNDGGFTYDPTSPFGTDSDSSSTAWTMWALTATGENIANWTKNNYAPGDYLTGNQTAGGFFSYQTGSGEDSFSAVTTAYAVIALSGKTLPLNTAVGGGGGGGPATHDLIVTIAGDGTGKVISSDGSITCNTGSSDNCVYVYGEGTKVVLTAVANAGSTFSDTWSGDCSGNDPTCTIAVNTEKHITAHFSKLLITPPPPMPPTPVPDNSPSGQVLGDITSAPSPAPSVPVVLPVQTNLPRTGVPPWILIILLFSAIIIEESYQLLKN